MPPRAFSEHSEYRRYDSSGEQIGSVENLYVNQEAKEGRWLKRTGKS
jgi:hypothetical protein